MMLLQGEVAVHENSLTPWTLPVNSRHSRVGRQGGICLERGTALVCRVVIALAYDPGCRFRSFPSVYIRLLQVR